MAEAVRVVTVLGAGTMGRGIAQLCASRGTSVRLFDVQAAALDGALAAIEKQLGRMVEKKKLTPEARAAAMDRIARHTEVTTACAGADLVIEAAPEDMALKVELMSRVKAASGGDTLLASNTSSLSITELGQRIDAAARTVGLHFFNPPPVMPLLEIVRGLGTSEATVERALAFAKQIEKEPIVVNDVPGFASSRLGVALGAEAMRMLESGVASAQDIDRAMELGYRHPMGPLKLTDLVGLDVRLAILEHLQREVGEQFRPPTILRQMVRAGRLGKKVGLGFYRWTDDGPVVAD
ncbi:MAG: 3-hydroxyacyl-CoA dehydrogenase family protein [Myxococcales bacterium]|nr:3-hydroxyacyl-CoA dehydrogenase family protein [Myxococcales bacterium]MCB9578881.1 3-hydroxyacyl-CoA dehydrogenase family protein [Polyangiaceae bacterium]